MIMRTYRRFHWWPTIYLPVSPRYKTKLLVFLWWSMELPYTSGETLWYRRK